MRSVFWNWYCFIILVSNDFFYLDQFVKHLFIQFLESVLILPHSVEIAEDYFHNFYKKFREMITFYTKLHFKLFSRIFLQVRVKFGIFHTGLLLPTRLILSAAVTGWQTGHFYFLDIDQPKFVRHYYFLKRNAFCTNMSISVV